MHGWSFQRLIRWFVPVFVFAAAFCVVVARQKAAGAGLFSFLDDRTYADCAVARNLIEKHSYALYPGQPAPATRHVLWRLTVALPAMITGNEGATARFLGAVFSLMTILCCLRLSHLLFPFPPFVLYSAVLLVLAPALLLITVDQPPWAMSTALFTAACLFHVEGLSDRQSPLPMRSAMLVGLLMWMQIEFLLLWMVFFAHAIVVNRLDRERPIRMAFVVTRGLTGVFLLALSVFPLLAWNFSVIRVPWPQVIGAPSVMDTWLTAGVGKSVRTYFSLAGGALPGAFSKLYATPFLSGLLERILVWFGALFIAGRAIGRPEERPFTLLLFLLLLMPACYALVYPYFGWQAAAPVFSALTPLCVIAASAGVFRIPLLVENLFRKWKKGWPAASGFHGGWIILGSILLFVCLIRNGLLLNHRNSSLVKQMDSRAAVSDAMASGAIQGKWIVTDQPGWLAYAHHVRVADLTGEFTPEVLACLDDQGGINASELAAYLANEKPDSMILWTPEHAFVSSLVPCKPVVGDVTRRHPEWPTICSISRSGAF
jgi:hypothetical protein